MCPPSGTYSGPVQWASTIGNIQETGRNVVALGATLTATTFIIKISPGLQAGQLTRSTRSRCGATTPTEPSSTRSMFTRRSADTSESRIPWVPSGSRSTIPKILRFSDKFLWSWHGCFSQR